MLASRAFRVILSDCRVTRKHVQLPQMAGQPQLSVRLYHVLRTSDRSAAAAVRGLSRPARGWRAAPIWLSAHCQSTDSSDSDYIPSPPRPPGTDQLAATPPSVTPSGSAETVADLVEPIQMLNALGEPSLVSLGLGGWTPPGLFQQFFEMLHVTGGLPWWGAIALGTVIIRVCMFPLVVKAQKNAVVMNNNLPKLQGLHMKMIEARQMGNEMEAARWSNELMLFMKEKEVNPLKSMLVPMAQIPVFVSVFFGLRQLTNIPLVSLKDGGMLWFVDLAVPDPYCLLPAITSLTMLATIELGAEGGKVSTGPNQHLVRYVLRAMPFIVFPLTMNFPAAILCYWVCSNLVALNQVLFLKIPAVRTYFKIPAKIKHDETTLPVKKKPFVAGIKESWNNMKITKDLEDRQRYDEMRFKKAGLGPVAKTYTYDPTRQNPDGSLRKK